VLSLAHSLLRVLLHLPARLGGDLFGLVLDLLRALLGSRQDQLGLSLGLFTDPDGVLLGLLQHVGHPRGQATRLLAPVGRGQWDLDPPELGELGGQGGEDLRQVREVRPHLVLVVALGDHGERATPHLIGGRPIGGGQPVRERIRRRGVSLRLGVALGDPVGFLHPRSLCDLFLSAQRNLPRGCANTSARKALGLKSSLEEVGPSVRFAQH
jgi:hypothetical protein